MWLQWLLSLRIREARSVFKVEGLYKTFEAHSANEVHAINGVDLVINDGDFITVIGSNGAGKSTLLNLLSGSVIADSGKIYLDDLDVTKMPEYKRAKYIGRVFQDPRVGTCPDLSIIENMSLSKRRGKLRTLRLGMSKSEKEEYINDLKTLNLGLEDRPKSKAGLLSGGQRQALTLLMATLVKPKLLLLDEHTAALDPGTAAVVLSKTEEIINKHNLTAFMVTHNMKDALKYGNRLIMMDKGRIVLDISGEEKKKLTVADLLKMFEKVTGNEIVNDSVLLA